MQTIDSIQHRARTLLQAAGIQSAGLDARVLLAHLLGIDTAQLIADGHRVLSLEEQSHYIQMIERRAQHEPVAHITGYKEFWGLTFSVGPQTLIPRPDSETVITTALQEFHDRREAPLRILDLGTGSGALIGALLKEFRQAQGVATDISDTALTCAKANAERLGYADRVSFLKSDWFENVEGVYDLIVSNPPYIAYDEKPDLPVEVANYEPASALFSYENGMADYRQITKSASAYLAPKGYLILEIGHTQSEAVSALLSASGGQVSTYSRDLSGTIRVISANYP